MSTNDEESMAEGHTILLLEPERNERTYSDYPNLATCLSTIVHMFEESVGDDVERDFEAFCRWIDDFYLIKLFSMDRTISRYKMKSGSELKKLFEPNDDNNGQQPPAQNGHSQMNGHLTNSSVNSCSLNLGGDDHRMIDMEESDGDNDDENWDD